MNRLGVILLNVAVALYLFANGILGFNKGMLEANPFRKMLTDILGKGDFTNALVIILSVCAIAGAVFLLLALFKVEVPITGLILFVFVIVWAVYIVFADIIHPLNNKTEFLPYLVQLSSHLMVLGAIVTSAIETPTSRIRRR